MAHRTKLRHRWWEIMPVNSLSDQSLFKTSEGHLVKGCDFMRAFAITGACDCDYLYIHTGLSFGLPTTSKRQILSTLVELIINTGVPNIIFPTYTFSFCNGEAFDVQHSKTWMGALNEFARNDIRFERSRDPMLSVCISGNDKSIVRDIGKYSIGNGSSYDILDRKNGVKFMFLGIKLGACFTYMHFLEYIAKVPYRYQRKFEGTLCNYGVCHPDDYYLFVRYNGVLPNQASYEFEKMLEKSGHLKTALIGENAISVIDKEPARELYLNLLDADQYHFVTGDIKSRDTTFEADKMRAL